jgi:hypothetical protein
MIVDLINGRGPVAKNKIAEKIDEYPSEVVKEIAKAFLPHKRTVSWTVLSREINSYKERSDGTGEPT